MKGDRVVVGLLYIFLHAAVGFVEGVDVRRGSRYTTACPRAKLGRLTKCTACCAAMQTSNARGSAIPISSEDARCLTTKMNT